MESRTQAELFSTEPGPFILSLPKAELHLHLEGTADGGTLAELSRRHDSQPLSLQEIEKLYSYQDFPGFLLAFKAVTERLRTAEDYEFLVYRLMKKLRGENVLHAEVYVSVGVVLWRGQRFEPIFEGLERGRVRGEKDFGVSVYWIFDAVRHFGAEAAAEVFDLAARLKDRNVVAVGIGGDEQRAPAAGFEDLYRTAKNRGLRLTAHAGENVGPESIWAAINIGSERIGHGLTAFVDDELMHLLAERQIPLEVCVTSNVKTGCLRAFHEHPVKRYFEAGLMITLNSDDPAMFGTTCAQEYQRVQQVFEFSDEQLRELARNSFEASFLPAEKKLQYLKMVDAV